MEGKTDQAAANEYEEFEPFCKWQRKEDRDVLEVHLPEFKKEQLKVQISNYGILKISGERRVDASRKSKFYKEVHLSSNYDTPAIHAKFVSGCLYITIPKMKNLPAHKDEQKKPPGETEPSKIHQTASKPGSTIDGGAKEQIQPSGSAASAGEAPGTSSAGKSPSGSAASAGEAPGTSSAGKSPATYEFEGGETSSYSDRRWAKVAVMVVGTAAVAVAMAAYVVYMYKLAVDDEIDSLL